MGMKLNIPFLVLAHFTIVGAQYDATGSAILDCAENWNCTVTGKTTSACNVESDDLVFVNEFGYRGEGREEDGPCYDSEYSGGVYVTDSKEFSSCPNPNVGKPAGKIMLKGDDCNVKCDNCSLLFRLVPPGDDEEEEKEKEITNAPSEKKEKEGTTTAPTPKEKEITNAAPSAGGLVMMATMQGVVGALLLTV